MRGVRGRSRRWGALAAVSLALHAAVLGFVHPVTGAPLRFETDPPADMIDLERRLGDL